MGSINCKSFKSSETADGKEINSSWILYRSVATNTITAKVSYVLFRGLYANACLWTVTYVAINGSNRNWKSVGIIIKFASIVRNEINHSGHMERAGKKLTSTLRNSFSCPQTQLSVCHWLLTGAFPQKIPTAYTMSWFISLLFVCLWCVTK